MSDSRHSLVSHPAKVSFTVRRPSPLSRQSPAAPDGDSAPSFRIPPPRSSGLNNPTSRQGGSVVPSKRFQGQSSRAGDSDSDDDDHDEAADELVTSFDEMGVQRANRKSTSSGPMVIPALANRDWRAVVKARQAASGFVPEGARAAVKSGVDGSQGGLGTRDTINSGPQLQGLIVPNAAHRDKRSGGDGQGESMDLDHTPSSSTGLPSKQATDVGSLDDMALQEILRNTSGSGELDPTEPVVIPLQQSRDEVTAFQEDVIGLPDEATLDDYARVPVEQFGAALLRGMGWKEGNAASRTAGRAIEPYVPAQRPALLGIGAKARPVEPSSDRSRPKGKKDDKRYVPLIRRELSDGGTKKSSSSRRSSRSRSPPRRSDSRTSSRRPSRSPSPSSSRRHNSEYADEYRSKRRRDDGHERDRGGEGGRDRDRRSHERDRDGKNRR